MSWKKTPQNIYIQILKKAIKQTGEEERNVDAQTNKVQVTCMKNLKVKSQTPYATDHI